MDALNGSIGTWVCLKLLAYISTNLGIFSFTLKCMVPMPLLVLCCHFLIYLNGYKDKELVDSAVQIPFFGKYCSAS